MKRSYLVLALAVSALWIGVQGINYTNTIRTSASSDRLIPFWPKLETTTVNVPDGGAILLDGIKGMNQRRNDFGTPILSKPHGISTLSTKYTTDRETERLMTMVSPRIIIEEEEEKLGVTTEP